MEEKKRVWYGFILLTGLLVLRLIWDGVGRYITYPNTPFWHEIIFASGTYLLTGLFIYLERDRLSEFHITSGALWIILLSPIVVPFTHWVFDTPLFIPPFRWEWYMVLIWPMVFLAIVFLFVYIRNRKSFRLTSDSFRQLSFAALAGILIGVVPEYHIKITSIPDPFQINYSLSLPIILTLFITQVGLPGVLEEPLFRGFLWGYLKQRRMPEIWIWLLQTFLFGLAHIYHLRSRPDYFWIYVPLSGLVVGYVAWRSRSIAASMITHAFVNFFAWLIPNFIQLP